MIEQWDGAPFKGAAPATRAEVENVSFGDEGQRWELMPLHDFLHHPEATPHLRLRLADYLAA